MVIRHCVIMSLIMSIHNWQNQIFLKNKRVSDGDKLMADIRHVHIICKYCIKTLTK